MAPQRRQKSSSAAAKAEPVPMGPPPFDFLTLFKSAPLSPHPDVDRFFPRILVGSVLAVTALMSGLEFWQQYCGYDTVIEDPEDEFAGQPSQGQFSRKITVHEQPIPVESWPRNVEGKLIFQPTYDWQEVPEDCVCPPGLEFQINTQAGTRMARAKR